jgi:uncharacterized ferredoxin-like protein
MKCPECGIDDAVIIECGLCGRTECDQCLEIEYDGHELYGDLCPECVSGGEADNDR